MWQRVTIIQKLRNNIYGFITWSSVFCWSCQLEKIYLPIPVYCIQCKLTAGTKIYNSFWVSSRLSFLYVLLDLHVSFVVPPQTIEYFENAKGCVWFNSCKWLSVKSYVAFQIQIPTYFIFSIPEIFFARNNSPNSQWASFYKGLFSNDYQ